MKLEFLRLFGYRWYTVLQGIPIFLQGTGSRRNGTPLVHARAGRTDATEFSVTSRSLKTQPLKSADHSRFPLEEV